MSLARKCDRCGRFYEKNSTRWYLNGGSITRGINIMSKDGLITAKYDLCDLCIKDLRYFMDYDDKRVESCREVDKNGEE